MNRNELASALNVGPWDVADWLLRGCPAKKFRNSWEFDLEKVTAWLQKEKIKIKIKPTKRRRSSSTPRFDPRWLAERCPICIDRGLAGEKAGKVCTMGEVLENEWHLRRIGIPCGHSVFLKQGG